MTQLTLWQLDDVAPHLPPLKPKHRAVQYYLRVEQRRFRGQGVPLAALETWLGYYADTTLRSWLRDLRAWGLVVMVGAHGGWRLAG